MRKSARPKKVEPPFSVNITNAPVTTQSPEQELNQNPTNSQTNNSYEKLMEDFGRDMDNKWKLEKAAPDLADALRVIIAQVGRVDSRHPNLELAISFGCQALKKAGLM